MGAFVLFVFVFASQVIGGFNTKLPPLAYGNTISILSIDGGGIRGIIPAIVLGNLEKALQIVSKDEKAALADYFDVIIRLYPNPSDPSHPILPASDILKFYLDYGPSIFNQTSASGWNQFSQRPKYDGKFLHDLAHELLQETRLHDALTNVVIPTFDIQKVHPVIFSSFKTKKVPSLDAKLSDIALATSAAPTQLPPIYFENGGEKFNLVDGGVTSVSPALIAVSEVIQQLNEENLNFIPLKTNKPTKIVLLSLGCGRYGETQGDSAEAAQKFSSLQWITPLLKGVTAASGDLNDYHLASVFPNLPSSNNYYLRIEEYNLDPSIGSDNSTKENMDILIKVGEDLLKDHVKITNITSFVPYEKPSEGTNVEALERFAEILYNEKQLRLKMKSIEKRGRPFIESALFRMSGIE